MSRWKAVWNDATNQFDQVPDDEDEGKPMHFDNNDPVDDKLAYCFNRNCELETDHRKDPTTQDCVLRTTPLNPSSHDDTLEEMFPMRNTIPWTPPKEKCRHAPTAVFRVKDSDVVYYGGSDSKVQEFDFEGLVICLLGRDQLISPKKPVRSTGDWAKKLKNYMDVGDVHPNYMTIDWPDYSIPPVLPGFFKALQEEVEEKGIKKVLFFCMGGHGRTGTALASVLIEVCNFSSKQATRWVHEKYCKEAIESTSQKDWLKDIAGEPAAT